MKERIGEKKEEEVEEQRERKEEDLGQMATRGGEGVLTIERPVAAKEVWKEGEELWMDGCCGEEMKRKEEKKRKKGDL